MPLRSLMVRIPLVIKHILIELVLGTLPLHLLRIAALISFVLIAFRVAPCFTPMLAPILQTHPAIASPAFTVHMVAPLVLFNRFLALRTWLGVGKNPGCVLALILILLVPFLRGLAPHRIVLLEPAF